MFPSLSYIVNVLRQGYWAVIAAIRKNARVIFLLNRKSNRADAALQKFKGEKTGTGSTTDLVPIDCDLMSFASGYSSKSCLRN